MAQHHLNQLTYVRGRITYYNNRVDTHGTSKAFLDTAAAALRKLDQKFEEAQTALEQLDTANEESREPIENDLFELDVKIRQKYAELRPAEVQTSQSHTSTSAAATVTYPKLPDLAIPKFEGSKREWLPYKRFMTEMLVNRPDIPDLHKFQYLKSSCLGGEAKTILDSVSDSNFVTAWANLSQSYDNDVALKYLVLEDLYEVPTPKPGDPKTLQQFVDKIETNVSYLSSIQVQTSQWDLLLGFHLMKRLDAASRTEFEKARNINEIVTVKILTDFLKNRIRVLNVAPPTPFHLKVTSTPKATEPSSSKNVQRSRTYVSTTIQDMKLCGFCKGDHSVMTCKEIKDLSVKEIKDKARSLRLCFNCLKPNHQVNKCPSVHSCTKCGSKLHHTILHVSRQDANQTQNTSNTKDEPPLTQQTSNVSVSTRYSVVLATAIVLVRAKNNMMIPCRAFLDSGSSTCFMTTKLAQTLKLPLTRVNVIVEGVNGTETSNKQKTFTVMKSRTSDYEAELEFLVTQRITSDLPIERVTTYDLQLPDDCTLADPMFYQPGPVDLLLGAEVFFSILRGNKQQLSNGLWLYNSELGHLVAGKTIPTMPTTQVSCVALADLQDQLKKFWEVEASPFDLMGYSVAEKAAEDHYKTHVERLPCGRYQVALPFNDKFQKLGESKARTRSIFLATERRLEKAKTKHEEYQKFMQELIDLDHMEPASNDDEKQYFMTHHMIERPSSTTTKYRVVFNASKKTTSGVSLNETLMIGPTIQHDLFTLLIQWRELPVALTADITKMYRQVLIRPQDRLYQRIWWRRDNTEEVKPFQLRTVTYGTASAPFAAIRTLKQLAMDEAQNYADVADLLINSFYVDDFVRSFSGDSEAETAKQRLVALLKSGGFELRKWNSNRLHLCDDPDADPRTTVLGIPWNRATDDIILDFSYIKVHPETTKSSVLSEIAQFFDPIGLCAPVILRAKIFMQKLWEQAELDWHNPLPDELKDEWQQFREELMSTPPITVSRPLITSLEDYELHGYADASNVGLSACLYVVTKTSSRILCGKSKVAPLKRLTMPRLELMAALLLAKLVKKVRESLQNKPKRTILWSDSEITIFRIKSAASKYSTFVSVRLAEIQDCTNPDDWRATPGDDNPADIGSRGISPREFAKNNLWMEGASYLLLDEQYWPSQAKFNVIDEKTALEAGEKRKEVTLCVSTTEKEVFSKLFSSYIVLVKSLACALRFYLNARKPKIYRNFDPVDCQEVEEIERRLIRRIQFQEFANEMSDLRNGRCIKSNSRLIALNPFIDQDGLIRVGGRIRLSQASYDQRHQIVLPKCHLSRLILDEMHESNLHCGPQTLLNTSRQRFWILGARQTCRKVVHECTICFKNKPVLLNQLMGDLPAMRLAPSRPFLNTGMDFCGPFSIRPQPRSKTVLKMYICVFTCFVTRCVHLEIVYDLSTKAFLSSLRRFVSRRGLPSFLSSDNATNFIGAKRELDELRTLFLKQDHVNRVKEFCSTKRIKWLTIPPRSPHWGGLWESMVKRVKHHLKRSAGSTVFHPDDFLTLVAEIEGIINSRPMSPISNHGDDLQALTPGHFLIGEALNAIPEPDWRTATTERLEQWQQRQQLMARVWQRFQHDYLSELQQRAKWFLPKPNIELNRLVLLHEDNVPPYSWRLGRVIVVHPGKDDLVRAVTVKTADGTYLRSINKVAPLPKK